MTRRYPTDKIAEEPEKFWDSKSVIRYIKGLTFKRDGGDYADGSPLIYHDDSQESPPIYRGDSLDSPPMYGDDSQKSPPMYEYEFMESPPIYQDDLEEQAVESQESEPTRQKRKWR